MIVTSWIQSGLNLFRHTPSDSGALKITFMTTLGVNVGDEFIREGIRAALERIDIPYEPLYVNKHDPRSLTEPHEDESSLVRDKYWDSDMFIQAGAPVYWHLHRGASRSVNSEWHSWLWQERILNHSRSSPLFLNLGAGSCQPWKDNGESFLADAECTDFARAAGRRSALTVVRDELASRILTKLEVPHERVCCPAFLAGARHRLANPRPELIGVNLMPLGAHYDLRENFDRDRWTKSCESLCKSLRKLGRLVFIAHDTVESEFSRRFARSGERVYLASSWRPYLDMYSSCQLVVANRVHGAVCASGFGVPSIILGNDTRAQIGEYIGLPIFGSADLNPTEVVECANRLLTARAVESERLLHLREQTLNRYKELLTPLLTGVAKSKHAA
ncbi:MAG: hypothetical protein C0467_03230 [Planctomycetaceae bacterium]|nr:hypothetical protein [Planctomycetaceae bacterium]